MVRHPRERRILLIIKDASAQILLSAVDHLAQLIIRQLSLTARRHLLSTLHFIFKSCFKCSSIKLLNIDQLKIKMLSLELQSLDNNEHALEALIEQ